MPIDRIEVAQTALYQSHFWTVMTEDHKKIPREDPGDMDPTQHNMLVGLVQEAMIGAHILD